MAWNPVLGGVTCVAVTVSMVQAAWSTLRQKDPKTKLEEDAGKRFPERRQGKLPVTVVTGFLGSGKTTLVSIVVVVV